MDDQQKIDSNFFSQNWVSLFLLLVMGLAALAMFYMMTRPNQSPREAALEAVILTVASIIASYVITSIFAERSYTQSLRDHGVQIASGIMVLKRQLQALTDWVGQKRATLSEGGRANQASDAVLEHVEQTLLGFSGMTDTALGGIAGVIGDALAQYQTVMEQVSSIRSEAVQKTTQIEQKIQVADSGEEVAKLQNQIKEIAAQTEKQIARLTWSSALPLPNPAINKIFNGKCPYCRKTNLLEMLDRQGETQVIPCGFCNRPFNAHVTAAHSVITRPRWEARQYEKTETELQDLLAIADSWIDPDQLRMLVPIVLAYDDKLNASGKPNTPYELQSMIFQDPEKLNENGLSRSAVRRFLKLVYIGRGFTFERGQRAIFKSVYTNKLTANGLLRAFVNSSVHKIASWQPVSLNDVDELTHLLLRSYFEEGTNIVKEAIANAMERERLAAEVRNITVS